MNTSGGDNQHSVDPASGAQGTDKVVMEETNSGAGSRITGTDIDSGNNDPASGNTNGVNSGDHFWVDINMEGGSGKAYIKSPVAVTKEGNKLKAVLIWSSPNYDYMIVDGVRYDNENSTGNVGENSMFTIPVNSLDEPLTVIADTVAMSTPHEIEYTIHWGDTHPETYEEENNSTKSNSASDSSGSSVVSGSGSQNVNNKTEAGIHQNTEKQAGRPAVSAPDHIGEFKKTGNIELKYATQFAVNSYGDYSLISIVNSGDYLLIPKGMAVPDNVPADIIILKQPLDRTYLVSTSSMDLICECGALDKLKYSGTRAEDWYVEKARKSMEEGKLIYAGKYRAPDYELLLSGGCNLAIENTMIYHNPEVKEKLEELGIPVLVETSSYESHPLGRLEWIRLYGILFDEEDKSDGYYDEQLKKLEPVIDKDSTGVRVAFFHVTANGMINVRRPGDYISTMIGLSGGEYILTDKEKNSGASANASDNITGKGSGQSTRSDESQADPSTAASATASMNMQMEDFYAAAYDADILIYNSTISGEIHTVSELIGKNALFKDFKAVKNGRVYCTKPELFQKTTGIADFMKDLNNIFNDRNEGLTYLTMLR